MNAETLLKLAESGPVVIGALALLIGFMVLGWFLVRILPGMQTQGIAAVQTAVNAMQASVKQGEANLAEQKELRTTMAESQAREYARAEQRHAEVMTLLDRQHSQTMAAVGGLRADFLSDAPAPPAGG